jgi:hypothetical protein
MMAAIDSYLGQVGALLTTLPEPSTGTTRGLYSGYAPYGEQQYQNMMCTQTFEPPKAPKKQQHYWAINEKIAYSEGDDISNPITMLRIKVAKRLAN